MAARLVRERESMDECADRLIEMARQRVIAGRMSLEDFEARLAEVLSACEGTGPVEHVARLERERALIEEH
jgi:hypothetical protein